MMEGNYSFASQPQAVRSHSKFREPQIGEDGRLAINIMWYLSSPSPCARQRACTREGKV